MKHVFKILDSNRKILAVHEHHEHAVSSVRLSYSTIPGVSIMAMETTRGTAVGVSFLKEDLRQSEMFYIESSPISDPVIGGLKIWDRPEHL